MKYLVVNHAAMCVDSVEEHVGRLPVMVSN